MVEPPPEVARELKRQAQESNVISTRDYSAAQMVRTAAFWKVIAWVILVTSGGLALISQAVPAAGGSPQSTQADARRRSGRRCT